MADPGDSGLALRDQTTRMLAQAETHGDVAIDSLFPLVYDELRSIARRQLAAERPDHTLQATALVHEAYLRLVDDSRVTARGRAYFLGAAAQVMRRVLVDHARRRTSLKRWAGAAKVPLEDDLELADVFAEEILDLDRALERLADLEPRHARVVECR